MCLKYSKREDILPSCESPPDSNLLKENFFMGTLCRPEYSGTAVMPEPGRLRQEYHISFKACLGYGRSARLHRETLSKIILMWELET